MCIIYNHEATAKLRARKSTTIRVYKLYKLAHAWKDRVLISPYKYALKGSKIKKAGTYIAANEFSPKGIALKSTRPYNVKKHQLSSVDGQALDIWGFHCFLKRSDAVRYGKARLSLEMVVVPITVAIKDLIVAGTESFYPTATFKRITISKNAFAKAIEG